MTTWFTDAYTGEQLDITYTAHLSPKGNLLDLHHDAFFDKSVLHGRVNTMWRYREAIPIPLHAPIISMNEGMTPLLPIVLNGKKVFIKQEQLFSTGSYKDRGATVLMSHAVGLGITHVVQDSSGNAGCAIAAYAAYAGIACNLFVQADTSEAKLAQMQMYGARLVKINGSRESVAAAALAAPATEYYASHCYNPFFFHGTKTFAYEVWEQLNGQTPDAVVLPAGNGTLLIGCFLGFSDLLKAGYISKLPKLVAVQAANCAPLFHAFRRGSSHPELISATPTLAEGIAIASPVRGAQMLQSVRASGGCIVSVSESDIKQTWTLCGKSGFYIEPTSAATIAGMLAYANENPSDLIVSLFSGHGLKSTEKAMAYLGTQDAV